MKQIKLLEVSPENSLIFEGTFKEVTSKKIILTNVSGSIVAFKIKTTAPKQYCVRPSVGFIDKGDSKDISIMLQPLEYGPSEKAKHKFQVQSIMVESKDQSSLDNLWKNCGQEDICVSKLLCILIHKPDNQINANDIPQGEVMHDEQIVPELLNGQNATVQELTNSDESVERSQSSPDTTVDVTLMSCETTAVQTGGDEQSHLSPDTELLRRTIKSNQDLSEENMKLKDEVKCLKKTVFDYSYQLESMQAKEALKLDEKNIGDSRMVQRTHAGVDVNSRTQGTEQYGDDSCHNLQIGSSSTLISFFGMPLIIYLLFAFFIGLIIGKFML